MTAGQGIGWSLASFLALQFVTLVVVMLWPEVRSDVVTLGGVAAIVYLSSTALVLRASRVESSASELLGIRSTQLGFLAVGVGLGVTLKLPAEHLATLIERLYPTEPSQLAARAALFHTDNVAQLAGLSVVVCVLGPLAEEVFFRGALFGRMAVGSVRVATIVTSLCFVAAHANPRHWLPLLLVAASLGWLRASAGSLLPCLGLHVAFNSLGVLFDEMGYLSMTENYEPGLGIIALSWSGAAVLLLLGQRLAATPSARAARKEDEG